MRECPSLEQHQQPLKVGFGVRRVVLDTADPLLDPGGVLAIVRPVRATAAFTIRSMFAFIAAISGTGGGGGSGTDESAGARA